MKIKVFDNQGNLSYREMTLEEYLKEIYEQAKNLPVAQAHPEEFEKCFEEEKGFLIESFNDGDSVNSMVGYLDLMI